MSNRIDAGAARCGGARNLVVLRTGRAGPIGAWPPEAGDPFKPPHGGIEPAGHHPFSLPRGFDGTGTGHRNHEQGEDGGGEDQACTRDTVHGDLSSLLATARPRPASREIRPTSEASLHT